MKQINITANRCWRRVYLFPINASAGFKASKSTLNIIITLHSSAI